MGKIVTLLLLGFLTLFADGPVLKTGQTTVYRAGDDGTYQTGIARDFARYANGIITDHATGLEWQDSTSLITDWVGARDYCENLSLGGKTDWRLPSIEELKTLVDYNLSSINPIFQYNSASSFWSSSAVASLPSYVWSISHGGFVHWFDKSKLLYNDVRCVRGNTLSSPSAYIRDDISQTVYDGQTNLTWQDDVDVSNQIRTWDEAIDYCNSLTLAGVSGWRLPNISELYMIADRTRTSPAINPVFKNVASYDYWSSTTTGGSYYGYSSYAWTVSFNYGGYDAWVDKSNYLGYNGLSYARCVRSGKLGETSLSSSSSSSSSSNILYGNVLVHEGWNLVSVPISTDDEFDISTVIGEEATVGWKFKFITSEGDAYQWDKWENGVSLKLKNGEALFVGVPYALLPTSRYIFFQGIRANTLLKFEDKTYIQNKWYLLGFGYEVKVSDILTHYPHAVVWIMENGAYKKLANTDTIKIGQGFWFKYN